MRLVAVAIEPNGELASRINWFESLLTPLAGTIHSVICKDF
jgi:hypothetical protein